VVKRLQTNIVLDNEYFLMMSDEKKDDTRLKQIVSEREENAKIVGRLLEQLEI